MELEQVLQGRYHVTGLQAPFHLDRHALPRGLVHHRQDLQTPAVLGLVEEEIIAPYVVRTLGPPAHAAVPAVAQATAFPRTRRHFQALPLPKGMLTGQDPYPLDQRPIAFWAAADMPLRGPRLPQGPARPPLRDAQDPSHSLDGLASAGRAGQFPRRASWRMA